MKRIVLLACVVVCLAGAGMGQNGIWTIGPAGAPGSCTTIVPQAGVASFCAESDIPYVSNNGKFVPIPIVAPLPPVTTVFGRTGDVKATLGDYTFPLIGGQVAAGQLPATTTCTVSITLSGFTMDGKGNASGTGTATLSACK